MRIDSITIPISYLAYTPIYQFIPIKRALIEKYRVSPKGEREREPYPRVSWSNVNLQRGVYRSKARARAWLRAEEI